MISLSETSLRNYKVQTNIIRGMREGKVATKKNK